MGLSPAETQHRPGSTFRNRLQSLLRIPVAQNPAAASGQPRISIARWPGLLFWPIIAAALWALSHSYTGIIGDASFYVGRALADLDPNGVGRDMMFVHDGQSRFSLFPLLLEHLVAVLGTGTTGLLLGLLAMLAAFAAVAVFSRHYVSKPFIAIVLIFVAVLPTGYGASWHFNFSEISAVPRPFAEAFVLAALAALASGRIWLGFACLFVASLVHPLMALAGWGVFAIVLSREDRRWALGFGLGALLLIVGALAGVPLLHRLVVIMDPSLKAFAEQRSPHLFPTLWDIRFLGPMFAETASLAIAASFVEGRRRTILIAAILVGAGGVAAQALFGDHFSLLLVIQAQLWRMAWLTASLGAAALAFCAIYLWRLGPRGHITFALLTLAWLMCDLPAAAGVLATAAIGARLTENRITLSSPRKIAFILWGVAITLGLGLSAHYLSGYVQFMANIPAEGPHGIGYLWTRRYLAFPILGGVLFLAFARAAPRSIDVLLGALALFLSVAAVHFWDDRSSFQKLVDSGAHPPALMRIIDQKPGDVLWVDGLSEAWYLTGRPQWASPEQGVSTVFSPELLKLWRGRMRFLVREGLAEKGALAASHIPATSELPHLTEANLAALCTRPDAPTWVIAPVYKDTIIPPGFEAHEWRLPQPNFTMTDERLSYGWHRIGAYAILACASSKRP